MAILPGDTVFSARVNGAPASTDQLAQITYDTGSGTLGDIKTGMTILIGSSAGAHDKGFARIRKTPTATIFYIGEASELDVEDDDYITVINEFGIWPKHIIAEVDLTLMDYDIEYSDQHENLNPVAVMGPHAVSKLTGATVQHDRDGSDSWVLGSTISGYSWAISGPTAATIVVANPTTATPSFTTDTEGWYRIALTVTAANGKTSTGYRWWYVYSDSEPPVKSFRLGRCEGEAESGGWAFEFEMVDEAGLDTVRDRAMVVLFAEDWYGATQTSIGPQEGYENVLTWGWIEGESIVWDPETSTVSFTVRGPQWWIAQVPGFPSGVKYPEGGETGWVWLPGLTVDRGIFHHLYWHSTVMDVIDVQMSGDTRLASAIEGPLGSLWEQLTAMSELTILARPKVDRYGRLFVEIDSQYLPVADRSGIPVVQTLTSVDWRRPIDFPRAATPQVSMVDLSGVAYDGADATPFLARSPGRVFKRFGHIETRDHLLLEDQANANALAGLILGKLNNKYPSIPITLSANQRLIDIAPQQYLQLSIVESDTVRGITETNMKLIPRRVAYKHDPKTGMLITEIEAEAETFPELSVTVIKPQPPVIGVPDPPTVPIWPITPIGPPVAPPPWNPTPPPTITCIGDTGAPPNGPWQQWLDQRGLTIANAESLPHVTFNPATIGGPEYVYVRSSAFTHQTKMLLEGYFEQSDDGGVTWDVWPDNVGLKGRAKTPGTIIEADMSIYTGSRFDQRGGILSPGTVQLIAPPGYWEWRLDPGPEMVAGPGVLEVAESGNVTFTDGITTWQNTTAPTPDAYVVYKLTYDWGSLPPGAIHIRTAGVYFGISDWINQGSPLPTDYNAGYIPEVAISAEQHNGTDVCGVNPVTHDSPGFTPSGSVYYFVLVLNLDSGETRTVEICDIRWRVSSDGSFIDLLVPNSIQRIKRVRINDGYVYNICTE